MTRSRDKTYVISLGGSLIAPASGIDTRFLGRFRDLIRRQVRQGKRFIIVCGGGSTCRTYQKAASRIARLGTTELDWIGIMATRLNAQLVREIFGNLAHREVVLDPHKRVRSGKAVVIGAGWEPGSSSDYDAVLLAKNYGAKTVINLSDVDYVYDKDPRKYRSARPIPEMDWKGFRRMFGSKWSPGLNSPFDPIASKEADRSGLRVVIAEGKNLMNLADILDGRRCKGTVIAP